MPLFTNRRSHAQHVEHEASSKNSGRPRVEEPPVAQMDLLSMETTEPSEELDFTPSHQQRPKTLNRTFQSARPTPSVKVESVHLSNSVLPNLPKQREKIVRRNGVDFTLMVAGESGSGKSTFVNTLFGDPLESSTDHPDLRITGPLSKTTQIEVTRACYEEDGFNGRFTIVDTPGFGDYTNNNHSWVPIVNYIDLQHMVYMCEEEQPDRHNLVDSRVHVCLYFLQATGHSLFPLDIKAMRELGKRVNLIPVIAKADSMTREDLRRFKRIIRSSIESNGINVFNPPDMNDLFPFAITASENTVVTDDGREVRGRAYRWGVVEVENPDHSDFCALRDLIMCGHMLDLIDTTHAVHYESARKTLMKERLRAALSLDQSDSPGLPTASYMSPVATSNQGNGTTPSVPEPPMSSLELLSRIVPYGLDYLRNVHIESDLLYKDLVNAVRERFGLVAGFQEEKFKQWTQELRARKESMEHEIAVLGEKNAVLAKHCDQLELVAGNRRK